MVKLSRHLWLPVLAAGLVWIGCGGENPVGTQMEQDPPARLSKPAGTLSKDRAVLSVRLTRDGEPVQDLEVAFSRSISGRTPDYRWKGTTRTDGEAEIQIIADPFGMYWRIGATGYYLARAVDLQSGEIVGRWGSIPINGGKEQIVSLPVGGPASVTEPADIILTFEFTFENDAEGWTGDFVDLPTDTTTFGLLFDPRRSLPPELEEDRRAPFIAGDNHSADLFMFIKRQLDGLNPNTTYQIDFQVQIATNAPAAAFGIGGAPGESVFLKAGASLIEPVPVIQLGDIQDQYRLNIDKGNQSVGGKNAIVIGNVAKLSDEFSDQFEFKTLDNRDKPFGITTDAAGTLWVLFGTDSGFEGRTELYYTHISITFTQR